MTAASFVSLTDATRSAAYFSQTTLDSLGTIDSIPGVGDVPVPEGIFKSARAGKMNKRNDPMPIEDIGAATHEPWGITMTPSIPYAAEPPKWVTGSPQPSHSPRHGPGSYAAAQNAYPTPRSSYESADFSARPLTSHTNHPAAPVAGTLPNLHDTGLTGYRHPSPYAQSSSSSSDPGTSPRMFSSPLTPPSNVSLPLSTDKSAPKLVPLAYLQTLQPQRPRDPMDELYLKRFSTDAKESHRHSWASPPPLTGHGLRHEDEAKAALVRGSSRW